jgi:hypothetical protein
MTFTRALSTNNFGPAKIIVATSAANGTHSTLASAMAVAASGDTIILRDSVTENVTLTPGVNIASWGSGSSLNGTGKVSITGTLTMTGAGSCTISGIQLQTNSAVLLAVTGSAASIVNLENCYLNCTNNTGITFSSSSSSAAINISNSKGNLGTTAIAMFAHSSAGVLSIHNCIMTNTGGSTTASTVSAGSFMPVNSTFYFTTTTSSTGLIEANYCNFACFSINTVALTHGGSAVSTCNLCAFSSGTAIGLTASAAIGLRGCSIQSSNASAVTGAGIVKYDNLGFADSANSVATPGAYTTRFGIQRSTTQPSFLVTPNGTLTDVTGDATSYTVVFATTIFDQNSNFSSTTFTAPVTGRYQLGTSLVFIALTASHTTGKIDIVTSNRSFTVDGSSYGAVRNASNAYSANGFVLTDMDAADTATILTQISGGTKVVDIFGGSFYGDLLC